MTAISVENPYFAGIVLLLIGFFAGFVLAEFFSSRKKEGSRKNRDDSRVYLKGINYILSNQPDRAIEEFSKAVQINSDTVETYTALGNLFRSKGEVARAIRIHHSIMLRPNIDHRTKVQACYDLGLDYRKAGFVNKAIESFEELTRLDRKHIDAYVQLVELYEDTGEWEKAFETLNALSRLRKSDDSKALAHYQVEIGKDLAKNGEDSAAKKSFNKAISINRACADAYLHLGDIFSSEESYAKAIAQWKKMMEIAPAFTYLVFPRLEEAYFKLNEFDKMEVLLRENSVKNYHDINTHLALSDYLYKKSIVHEAIAELQLVLDMNPRHIKARQQLGRYLSEQGREGEAVALYAELLDSLSSPEKEFQCSGCGFESKELQWRCPQCRRWDTIAAKQVFREKAPGGSVV